MTLAAREVTGFRNFRAGWSVHLILSIEKWLLVIPLNCRRVGLIPAKPASVAPRRNCKLGYALDASARNGARLCAEHQPQRVEWFRRLAHLPRAAAGSSTTAALRLANLRQVHSPNSKFSLLNVQFSSGHSSGRLRLQ